VTAAEALAAFTRIREAAETYMEEMDALDLGWSEETVTDVCVHKGHPTVSVCKFNKNQEGGGVGADYLWWWLDRSSGVCFGMLVQAKRLTHQGTKWKLDVRHNNGKQYADLLKTAARLEVPAMYGVYTGGPTFRTGLACFHDKEPDCLGCRRMAISMVSAYQLSSAWALGDAANFLFNKSIPLEDLVDPARTAGPVNDLNLHDIPAGDLRDFLLDPQVGPREVAKRIFRPVSHQRRGMFSRASAQLIAVPGAPLFPDVPEDTGHFPGAYFRHFLQGLRLSPPRYVEELLERQLFQDLDGQPEPFADEVPAPAELDGVVDGVVLISL
jgi:hypothetical protein